jgi:hypothetical protein
MMKRLITVTAALMLSSCATTGDSVSTAPDVTRDPAVARALAGKVAGTPVNCLSLIESRNSQTYRGTIIYRVNRDLSYVNTLNNCPILNEDRIPVTRSYGDKLCRGDIVEFIDRTLGTPFGGCAMGDFIPYRAPATAVTK